MTTYLGIDLAASARRPSGFAVLDDALRLLALGRTATDDELLALAWRWGVSCVAIDAPLSLPRGMCCLRMSCGCQPQAADGRKAAEREICKQLGIGLFMTSKRGIIKTMTYRALGLKRLLTAAHYEVLEVYPFACKVALFGRAIPRKTAAPGRRWLREQVTSLIPALALYQGIPGHDELDALLAAYTAYQYDHCLSVALGDPDEGVIYVPSTDSGFAATACTVPGHG